MYDVIVAGASFAGLAVADKLRGHRTLLLDQKPIGAGQTSACGTILKVLEYWGLTAALKQTHDRLLLHTAKRHIEFKSPYKWCTFDYRRLCEILFQRSGAEFIQARVLSLDGDQVLTSEGAFRARCIVDATGWRAALASTLPGFRPNGPMNIGIETFTQVPLADNVDLSALHFWYDRSILPRGVGWAFPRGNQASIGVGSYGRARPLKDTLMDFAGRFKASPGRIHGTYFPFALRSATAGGIFVVGDAAGMCIGLTGEGIRPALFFGEACGRTIQRVLAGELSLPEALDAYRTFVESRRRFFRFFSLAQSTLPRLPPAWIDWLADLVRGDRLRPRVLDRYWRLTASWGGAAMMEP